MKQYINFFLTIGLWVLAVVLWATGTFPWLCVALIALHFVELITVGYRTGRKANKPVIVSVIMCMLFGFFWWLPLMKSMKKDDLTDADFIEDGLEPWREALPK